MAAVTPRRALGLAALPVLLGCAGSSSSTGSLPGVTVTVSPPTPTPGPDVRQVVVVATGLATYLETTEVIATVRDASATAAATGVTVHLEAVTPGGRVVGRADAVVGQLDPGASSVVAARIQLAGGGDHATARVTSATFAAGLAPQPFTVGEVALRCPRCGSRGSGDVTGTLSTTGPASGVASAFAACTAADGTLVGGGAALVTVTAAIQPIDVPVIVDGAVGGCVVNASPGGF